MFPVQQHPHRASFRGGHGAAWGPRPVYREAAPRRSRYGDTAKEIGEILVATMTNRHPSCRLGRWKQISARVAAASRVPVLNMQCDVYHPFQILADALTIMERFGRNLRGKKIT